MLLRSPLRPLHPCSAAPGGVSRQRPGTSRFAQRASLSSERQAAAEQGSEPSSGAERAAAQWGSEGFSSLVAAWEHDQHGGCWKGLLQRCQVLSCLWEASRRGLHTTGFCQAAQPGLVLIALLRLLPLRTGLATVSVVVVSMGSRFTVPTQVCGSLAADLVVVVRVEGVVLVDGVL